MTKEKIFESVANGIWPPYYEATLDSIYEAMEMYAKQEAIEFAKFAMDKSWQDLNNTNKWVCHDDYSDYNEYTDEQMYQWYLSLK